MVAAKKSDFGPILGQKRALEPSQELAQHHDKHEIVVYLVFHHEGRKKLEDAHKKMISRQKIALLSPKGVILGNRGHETVR